MHQFISSLILASFLLSPAVSFAQDTSATVNTRVEANANSANGTSHIETRVRTQVNDQKPRFYKRVQEGFGNLEERVEVRQEARNEAQEERAANQEARQEERRQMQEERQADIEERRAEVQERISEATQARVEAFLTRLTCRFSAAITRMEGIADRLESRINKLSDRLDTDEAVVYVADARAHIAGATEILADMEARIELVLESENPREELAEVRRLAEGGKAELQAAHEDLRNAVASLRAQTRAEAEIEADAAADE